MGVLLEVLMHLKFKGAYYSGGLVCCLQGGGIGGYNRNFSVSVEKHNVSL